ncbi:glycosyltransferase family 2 protein [Streptomyces sp. H10-C2]|uniref:glycosyltransferase n=1 Tax=unclassified Streptomyces TaxID=2593676 RepID=UPI0024B99EB8|nr:MULTISPECIES: glycosyltransferase family 2 protein [unclassified Streptomyces]MDJ0340927.1 glycosyltransferase family 2 protein [Streptomyces sp. PH10-H1]MDJ0369841.1 glycosyltransferase family 2 protein [Streptomyces sp. H10-C2]
MTSIVIPAHNEGRVIGRLLDSLLAESSAGEIDIVVVCNGCTDDTARVAGLRGASVRVVEIPAPSKHAALRVGDEHARGFPRLYVDADVVIGTSDVRALAHTLDNSSTLLATAPERDLPLAGCAWRVRAYYRVWQRLPAVREGLFGRGVIAVSEAGHARIAALPPLMADDLAASLAFGPDERLVVDTARVVVHPPRTWSDLIKRRIRAATSSAQLEQYQEREQIPETARAKGRSSEQPPAQPSARTSMADLRALLRAEPRLFLGVVVFISAALVARRGSRKAIASQDFGTWLRDESSREG